MSSSVDSKHNKLSSLLIKKLKFAGIISSSGDNEMSIVLILDIDS